MAFELMNVSVVDIIYNDSIDDIDLAQRERKSVSALTIFRQENIYFTIKGIKLD